MDVEGSRFVASAYNYAHDALTGTLIEEARDRAIAGAQVFALIAVAEQLGRIAEAMQEANHLANE